MADPEKSGIYEIVNLINGKRYVGSAISFKRRWRYHRRDLRASKHHSRYLQASWRKYGERAFEFRVLEYVEVAEELIAREQFYLDAMKPVYNTMPKAGSNLGHRWTAEQRARVSASRKGKKRGPTGHKMSDEHKAKLRIFRAANPHLFSLPHSDETKNKLSELAKARYADPEYAARVKAATSTPEILAARSARVTGNKYCLGMKHSDATKQKLRDIFKGRTFSDETRRKMTASQKAKAKPGASTRALMSLAHSGVKNAATILVEYTFYHEDGREITDIPMRIRAVTGILPSTMSEMLRGNRTQSKGWRLRS